MFVVVVMHYKMNNNSFKQSQKSPLFFLSYFGCSCRQKNFLVRDDSEFFSALIVVRNYRRGNNTVCL